MKWVPPSHAPGTTQAAKADGYNTAAGCFDDPARLAEAAASFDGHANVYVTINPVVPALHARYHDRVERRAKNTTSDPDIAERRFLYVDLDPRRPADVSASEEEVEAPLAVARTLVEHLWERGWGLPVTSMSGSEYTRCHGGPPARPRGYPTVSGAVDAAPARRIPTHTDPGGWPWSHGDETSRPPCASDA